MDHNTSLVKDPNYQYAVSHTSNNSSGGIVYLDQQDSQQQGQSLNIVNGYIHPDVDAITASSKPQYFHVPQEQANYSIPHNQLTPMMYHYTRNSNDSTLQLTNSEPLPIIPGNVIYNNETINNSIQPQPLGPDIMQQQQYDEDDEAVNIGSNEDVIPPTPNEGANIYQNLGRFFDTDIRNMEESNIFEPLDFPKQTCVEDRVLNLSKQIPGSSITQTRLTVMPPLSLPQIVASPNSSSEPISNSPQTSVIMHTGDLVRKQIDGYDCGPFQILSGSSPSVNKGGRPRVISVGGRVINVAVHPDNNGDQQTQQYQQEYESIIRGIQSNQTGDAISNYIGGNFVDPVNQSPRDAIQNHQQLRLPEGAMHQVSDLVPEETWHKRVQSDITCLSRKPRGRIPNITDRGRGRGRGRGRKQIPVTSIGVNENGLMYPLEFNQSSPVFPHSSNNAVNSNSEDPIKKSKGRGRGRKKLNTEEINTALGVDVEISLSSLVTSDLTKLPQSSMKRTQKQRKNSVSKSSLSKEGIERMKAKRIPKTKKCQAIDSNSVLSAQMKVGSTESTTEKDSTRVSSPDITAPVPTLPIVRRRRIGGSGGTKDCFNKKPRKKISSKEQLTNDETQMEASFLCIARHSLQCQNVKNSEGNSDNDSSSKQRTVLLAQPPESIDLDQLPSYTTSAPVFQNEVNNVEPSNFNHCIFPAPLSDCNSARIGGGVFTSGPTNTMSSLSCSDENKLSIQSIALKQENGDSSSFSEDSGVTLNSSQMGNISSSSNSSGNRDKQDFVQSTGESTELKPPSRSRKYGNERPRRSRSTTGSDDSNSSVKLSDDLGKLQDLKQEIPDSAISISEGTTENQIHFQSEMLSNFNESNDEKGATKDSKVVKIDTSEVENKTLTQTKVKKGRPLKRPVNRMLKKPRIPLHEKVTSNPDLGIKPKREIGKTMIERGIKTKATKRIELAQLMKPLEQKTVPSKYVVPPYSLEEKKVLYGDKRFVIDVNDVDKEPDQIYIWQILEEQRCLRQYYPSKYGEKQFFISSPVKWYFFEEEFRNDEFHARFQPVVVVIANEQSKCEPTQHRPMMSVTESVVQYVYVDKDFFLRMARCIGKIGKLEVLREKFMSALPILTLLTLSPSFLKNNLSCNANHLGELARNVTAWCFIKKFVDDVIALAADKSWFTYDTKRQLLCYPSLNCSSLKVNKDVYCSACLPKNRTPAVRVSFTAKRTMEKLYNPVTFETLEEVNEEKTPEVFWCRACANGARKLHRLRHFLYHLLRLTKQNIVKDIEIFRRLDSPITDEILLWTQHNAINWKNVMFLDFQICVAEVEEEFLREEGAGKSNPTTE